MFHDIRSILLIGSNTDVVWRVMIVSHTVSLQVVGLAEASETGRQTHKQVM